MEHPEIMAVRGRHVAYVDYPPTSAQETEAQRKPGPHNKARQ